MMKKATALVLTSLLSGCSFLDQSEILPLYTLKSEPFEATNALNTPLAVDMPLSEASLNTPRIAYTPSAYQRDYLADGQWPDRLPKIIQEVLIENLSQRWGGAHVDRVGVGLNTKYILQTEIHDFSVYPLDSDQAEARIKMTIKLIDFLERRVLAAQTFTETTQVTPYTMNGIVGAFNKGLHNLLVKAFPWLEEEFLKKKQP